uniref:Uncharacterized protein n=1 Tax=Ananas comosus var. bracteatus TaxID=296719 RepID=A0A6V7NF18_ANACO|nr:unnamed protein product [Ananas comosus var. bracteatus]
MAAVAAEAIKEREETVARLEGEKQSLEKMLEEREKEQAQEASELQTSMIETMEAVEIEKQKHNSTRMEAFARVARLEAVNADLAKSLAAAQWNLEVEDLPVGSPTCVVPNGPVVVNIPTLEMSLPHGIPFWRPILHGRAYVAMAISGVPACGERPSQACANEHNGKQA